MNVENILNTENKFKPTITKVDWGSGNSKAGKRVGNMVMGAMGVDLKGVHEYKNPFGNLPDYEDHKDEFEAMKFYEEEPYLKARSFGLDHEKAMMFIYKLFGE